MNLKNILVTAFDGEENSSRIICGKLKSVCEKIILPNNKTLSCEMLKNALDNNIFRYVISLGQKPVIKNKIIAEDTAKKGDVIMKTNVEWISEIISGLGYDCRISYNAGTSFCNNLYFFGMDHIAKNRLNTKMIFLHVPFEKNCNTDKIAEVIDNAISKIL